MKSKIKAFLAALVVMTMVFSSMTSVYADQRGSRENGKNSKQSKMLKQQQLKEQQLYKQQLQKQQQQQKLLQQQKLKEQQELQKQLLQKLQYEKQQLQKQQQLQQQQLQLQQKLQKQQEQIQKQQADINKSSDIIFTDVGKDFWAYQSIMNLCKLGVIKGYSDKTFRPNEKVTRAQFAIMLTRALDLKAADNTQKFADVGPTSWYFKEVKASENYLTGYQTSNGTLYFYGDKNAVREDMAVALVKALNLTLVNDNGQLQQAFTDYNEISAKLRDYINTAFVNGIMTGSEGKFVPQGTLTRASAAALLEKALKKAEKVPPEENTKVVVGNPTPVINTDATLSNLTFNGTAVTGFNSNTLTYNVVLPAGTTALPVVAATVKDTGKATAVVTQATALPGNSTIIVTAQDGKTQKIYTISFTVAAVVLSTDATLSNLTFNGAAVPGFNPNTLVYNAVLPAGTTVLPVVAATVTDAGKAAAVVTQAAALPGSGTIVVTAQDGKTQKVYTINFTVAVIVLNTDATLSNLTFNGAAVPGFNLNTLIYNVVLPAGTTALPVVAATVTDTGKATAAVTQTATLPGSSTTVVTAQDGKTQKVYTINFTVAASTDATLSNLTVNGAVVTGFNPNTLNYNVVLPKGTTALPVITATVNDTGKATAIMSQATALPGVATVIVTAQDGQTQKAYIINFTVSLT